MISYFKRNKKTNIIKIVLKKETALKTSFEYVPTERTNMNKLMDKSYLEKLNKLTMDDYVKKITGRKKKMQKFF